MNLIPRHKTHTGIWIDPFKELERMQNDINSLFNLSFSDNREKDGTLQACSWRPVVDYDETDNFVTIKADLPGVDRKDIKVTIQDGVLTIKGERKEEEKARKNGARITEKFYGQFCRQMTLPVAVDEAAIKANCKDGVLEIMLPKKEEAKPKEISIDVK